MDIPLIGFGTYRLKDSTYNSVKHAIKTGYRHIDTAPLYKNEERVGDAIKDCGIERKNLFVTTKISRDNLKTNDIKKSITESLKKLKLDYIDLILLHEPIDYVKNWQMLYEFYRTEGSGIVKNIGVSNFNIGHLNKIISNENNSVSSQSLIKPYCNQIEINPFLHRKEIVEFCNTNNINIVAHSPLAKGEKLNDKNLNMLSNRYNISTSNLMLEWNLKQNNIVIPRSSNNTHIEQNISNTNISKFSDEDIERLNNLDCQYSTHPKYLN